MGKYADMIAEAQQQMATINTDAETVLRKEWGDGFDTQMTLAQKAFHAVASEEDKANAGKLAKDPVIIRMLAKLGANLKEDPGLPPEISGMQPEDLDALMKSPAYWDAKHPDHMKVKNQVTRYFEVTSRKKAA
jgi:hypothetical protein